MPESKGRKPAKKRPAKKAAPRKRVLPEQPVEVPNFLRPHQNRGEMTFEKASRDPIRELAADDQFKMPKLPKAATHDQVLVAMAGMDALEQEVMIAQRLAAMPSQKDGGMPVAIHRHVRAPWARQLRKLGLFCIPELATHELVADPGGGLMANHTAARLRKMSTDDFWDMAKQQNPELGQMVDAADTPEKRRDAMAKLAKALPVELRIAFERLLTHNPEDLAPR